MFVLKTMTFHLLDAISQMSLNCVKWVSLLPDLELRLTSKIQVRAVSEDVGQKRGLAALPAAMSSHTCSLQAPPAPSLSDADRQPPSTRLWTAQTEPSFATCLPSLSISLQRRRGHINTHSSPSTRGQASSSVCSELLHLPHSECSVWAVNPLPFHLLHSSRFSRAAHHFLIKQ